MSTIPHSNTITDRDSTDVLQIPEIYLLPEMGAVRDLHRRNIGKKGCSKCKKNKLRPSYLAPSVGAGLIRAIRNNKQAVLYKSLANHFNLTGPIQLRIGPCQSTLKS